MARMAPTPHWTQFYTPGVPADIVPPREPLPRLIEHAARAASRDIATDFFGRTTTYQDLGDQVARAAEGLRHLGVRAGDRVAIILPNCPQHVVAFYAVLRLGAIVVEHNPLYTARELRHMFEDHAARIAICWDVAAAKLREQPEDVVLDHLVSVNLLDAFPWLKRQALRLPLPGLRATRAKLTAKVSGVTTWRKLLRHRPLAADHPVPGVRDLAVIQYTSGTTGLPKGAMLTHENLLSNALQARAWLHGIEPRREVVYSVLPMFHAFGMTLALTLGVLVQARIVLFPTFDARMVVTTAQRIPPTVLGGVPPIFHVIAAMAKRKHVSLSSARFCVCGAMSLSAETAAAWEAETGVPLIEGYGMTEASPVIAGNPVGPTRRSGTVGLPFPGTDVRVVDLADPTRDVAPGERGELLARGPQVFCGYWNRPEETEGTLLPGGWLRTGDIVTVDADGYITIVDRVKELIIVGGFNVSPTEVEAILRGHPDVTDAAVVGLPLPLGGERVAAAILPREVGVCDPESLRRYCAERLTAYKVPKVIVEVDDLPTSMLGKVVRAQVRDKLIAAQAGAHTR
ncbi:MAG: long-chain-fatty-acid--CoA ligase [Actinomycetia bacterium]|nr:long-chain-fatty-acid--CoA ligase [Actinomycetes bacterium]